MTRHAVQRAAERFGVDLTDVQLTEMAERIDAGKCPLIRASRHRLPCYIVALPDGRAAMAAYDARTGEIITFMPVPDLGNRCPYAGRSSTKPKRRVRDTAPEIVDCPLDIPLEAANDPIPTNNILAERLTDALRRASTNQSTTERNIAHPGD